MSRRMVHQRPRITLLHEVNMNIMRTFVFLFLTLFASYNFAEDDSANQPQFQSVTFKAYLTVNEVHDEGLVLKLNDGSEWDIKYFSGAWRLLGWGWTEQQEVSHWTIGDTIEIQYPGSGNLIDFVLLIKNLSKNEEALATLRQAPSVDYSACLWIADFDKKTNHITLSNETAWFRTTADMYGAFFQYKPIPLSAWEPGDALTLIRGDGWLNENTFFLWNHKTNEMPIVKRLN